MKDKQANTSNANTMDEPVTVAINRKVIPGFEREFEEWEQGIMDEAAMFPGYLGTNVIKPSAATNFEYVTIYRFDNYEHMKSWETSPQRAEWLRKAEDMIFTQTDKQKVTGLEVWFELPEIEISKHPVRYKMVIVLIVVLFLLTTLWHFVGPFMTSWPWTARTLLTIVSNVLLFTYFIMPNLARLLKNWLYVE